MGKLIKTKNELTPVQEKFINIFKSTHNVKLALRQSGMDRSNFHRDKKKDTPFGIAYRMAEQNAIGDFEFSKLESLRVLAMIRDVSAQDPETFDTALKAIAQMSKMQDNHLAVVKKEETKKNIEVKAVYDFTKPNPQHQLEDGIEEAEIIEIGGGDED